MVPNAVLLVDIVLLMKFYSRWVLWLHVSYCSRKWLHTNLWASSQCYYDCVQCIKVTQKNQLDATIIYWSTSSAQHVSGKSLPETCWAELVDQ